MIKWSVEVFTVNGQTAQTRRERVQQAILGTIDCQISQCCWKIVEAGREDIRSMDGQLCQREGSKVNIASAISTDMQVGQ